MGVPPGTIARVSTGILLGACGAFAVALAMPRRNSCLATRRLTGGDRVHDDRADLDHVDRTHAGADSSRPAAVHDTSRTRPVHIDLAEAVPVSGDAAPRR